MLDGFSFHMFHRNNESRDEGPVRLLAPVEGGAVVVSAVIGHQQQVAGGEGVHHPGRLSQHGGALHPGLPGEAEPGELGHVVHVEHLPPEGEAPPDRLPLHLLHLQPLPAGGASHGEGHYAALGALLQQGVTVVIET